MAGGREVKRGGHLMGDDAGAQEQLGQLDGQLGMNVGCEREKR